MRFHYWLQWRKKITFHPSVSYVKPQHSSLSCVGCYGILSSYSHHGISFIKSKSQNESIDLLFLSDIM